VKIEKKIREIVESMRDFILANHTCIESHIANQVGTEILVDEDFDKAISFYIKDLTNLFKSYVRELVPEELKEIYNYYLSTRRVGHTYSVMEGAKNTDCLVVCANKQQEREVGKQLLGKKTTTLANIRQELWGIKKPLLIDHYALCCLIGEMLRRIEKG